MKITHVGAVLLTPFHWVLVKVKTDEGITGIGEAYHGAGVHHIVTDPRLTERALIGKDPRNVDKLFHDMMYSMSASGFYQGAVMSAISGIEMALWDITGQASGIPIWQLLGGKFRDKIRVYNDCHAGNAETPESYAEKAKAVEGRGFDAIKFDIDPQPTERDKYNRCISNHD
ncbi:MAG: mandelate racemase/muconate lactonizing enzyme family protein, partial [Candidatus Latescibacteria bacterium]|nr:mandelate racemase/muconate lactonizing enzyme family protein [Candidatus Latescibacterota bacterium]